MTSVPHPHWPNINLRDPAVQQWVAPIYGAAVVWGPRIHVDINQLSDFATAWLAIESGGNICAVGNKYATVPPGGAPREIGLWQIYNPDDFKKLGLDPTELVAYCVRPAPGQKNPQQTSRQVTPAEKARHVDIGMQFIADKYAYAAHYLGASGVRWPTVSQDTWRMVKAVHGLPVLVNTGLAQVTHKLGRAPSSWAEYRSVYETINPRAKYDPRKDDPHSGIDPATGKPFYGEEQDGYYRALNNAEWTGGQVRTMATS